MRRVHEAPPEVKRLITPPQIDVKLTSFG